MSRARLGWRGVRALIMDVDGVLTDGGLYYTEQGDELKRFDVRDGQGLVLLRQAGILTAIVTGKRTALVVRRAEELGIAEVHQGVTDKAASKVKVEAATVEVTAGMVTVDTAMAKFSGIVKCETLIATSVISTSYTPGAGNIW